MKNCARVARRQKVLNLKTLREASDWMIFEYSIRAIKCSTVGDKGLRLIIETQPDVYIFILC